MVFIIQHLNALDKQFRDMFAEHFVYCNRMDRLRVPFGFRHVLQLFGFSGNLPKIHCALVMYGSGNNAIKVDSWIYTGKDLYDAFATEQGFSSENEGGIYQLIPPYYTHGRFYSDWDYFKSKTANFIKNTRVKTHQFFSIGLLGGVLGTLVVSSDTVAQNPQVVEADIPKADVMELEPVIEEEEKPYIYITGSLIGDKHRELMFEKDGFPLYARDEGYKYLIRNKCHAILIKAGNSNKEVKTSVLSRALSDDQSQGG